LVASALCSCPTAAALLSNSPAKARFRLQHVVRTLTGAQDSEYTCVFQFCGGTDEEDVVAPAASSTSC